MLDFQANSCLSYQSNKRLLFGLKHAPFSPQRAVQPCTPFLDSKFEFSTLLEHSCGFLLFRELHSSSGPNRIFDGVRWTDETFFANHPVCTTDRMNTIGRSNSVSRELVSLPQLAAALTSLLRKDSLCGNLAFVTPLFFFVSCPSIDLSQFSFIITLFLARTKVRQR